MDEYRAYSCIARDRVLPIPPPGFDALSVDEQIDYVQSWEHMLLDLKKFPSPIGIERFLAERLAAHHADKNQGKDWEE